MTTEYECPNCGTLSIPVNPHTQAIKCRCGKTFVVLDEIDGTILAELPDASREEAG